MAENEFTIDYAGARGSNAGDNHELSAVRPLRVVWGGLTGSWSKGPRCSVLRLTVVPHVCASATDALDSRRVSFR